MHDKQLMGTETEYSSFDFKSQTEKVDLILSKIRNRFREYLPNGGRMYKDQGEHLEYGTPECLTPLEATTYHHAGDSIVWKAARQVSKWLEVYRLNEAPSAESGGAWETFGCHENYLIKKSNRQQIYGNLPVFLVTRTILTGNGSLKRDSFTLSQRAGYIKRVISSTTTSDRPLINTREEGLLSSTQYERLHLICGDCNVSPWATFLKLGSTALVIATIELGVSYDHLTIPQSIEFLHELNKRTPLSTIVRTDEYWSFALEVQSQYLRAVKHYGEKGLLPVWYSHVVSQWEIALQDISNDWRNLVGILDWATKCELLTQANEEGYKFNSPEMDWMALQYHHVDHQQSLYEAIRLDRKIPLPYSKNDLDKAAYFPTRHRPAIERSNAVRARKAQEINWEKIVQGGVTQPLPV